MAGEPEDGGATTTSRRHVGGRDLAAAIGAGVALAVLFLGTLFWHPAAFTIVVFLLTSIAYLEVGRVLKSLEQQVEVAVLVIATFVMLFGAYRAGRAGQSIGVGVLLAGAVLAVMLDPGRRDVVRRLGSTVLLGLWVGFLASYAVLLLTRPLGGPVAVLAVIGAAALADIGGYAVGVPLGRHKVAPSISPSKTWEGLAGGLVVAVVAGAVVLPLLDESFTAAFGALLAGVCGLAAFFGDLTESMVKRDLGVKDLGAVLPGHGGILDRVDGILFALPVGFYVIELQLL